MRAAHKELYRAQLKSSNKHSSSKDSEICVAPELGSQASEADSSQTALSTVSDVRNLTKHPRYKRKLESTAGLSYKPHTTSASNPTDQGLSTESNSTTHNMHPDLFRKARGEYNCNATDRSRQSTPSSSDSSLSSLTLATSEHEISDKAASTLKDPPIPISSQDTKGHFAFTKDVKGNVATEILIPEPKPPVTPVASDDKGPSSRQSSQSSTTSARVTTRNATRAAKAARGQTEGDDLRPEGPRHLEYDVTIAQRMFKEAVYAALYDHFGYAPRPSHRISSDDSKPGPESAAVIQADWRVVKASKVLNEADKKVRDALARGETWENTPVPDEWKWGSEFLKPLEDLRVLCEEPVELHPVKAKRGRKPRVAENAAPPMETRGPRTRKQKERATADSESIPVEVHASIQVSNTPATTKREATERKELQTSEVDEDPSIQTDVSGASTSEALVTPPIPEVIAASESLPSVPAKRSRGRPRKRGAKDTAASPPINDDGFKANEPTSMQTETSSPSESEALVTPSVSEVITASESLPSLPAKRPRGRPRKRKLEDAPASSSSNDVTPVANSSPPLRQSKRRRTTL